MWHMHDSWGWWMLITWIGLIALILFIVWAVRAVSGPSRREDPAPRQRSESDPLEILNRRYASGELTEEEYERKRRRILDRSHDGDPKHTDPT